MPKPREKKGRSSLREGNDSLDQLKNDEGKKEKPISSRRKEKERGTPFAARGKKKRQARPSKDSGGTRSTGCRPPPWNGGQGRRRRKEVLVIGEEKDMKGRPANKKRNAGKKGTNTVLRLGAGEKKEERKKTIPSSTKKEERIGRSLLRKREKKGKREKKKGRRTWRLRGKERRRKPLFMS